MRAERINPLRRYFSLAIADASLPERICMDTRTRAENARLPLDLYSLCFNLADQ